MLFKASEDNFQRRMIGVNPLTSSELVQIKASFGNGQLSRIDPLPDPCCCRSCSPPGTVGYLYRSR